MPIASPAARREPARRACGCIEHRTRAPRQVAVRQRGALSIRELECRGCGTRYRRIILPKDA